MRIGVPQETERDEYRVAGAAADDEHRAAEPDDDRLGALHLAVRPSASDRQVSAV